MTSYEYATKLEKVAAYLRRKPEFEVPGYETTQEYLWYMSDKDNFLAAVKALGAGEKSFKDDNVLFTPVDGDGFYLRTAKSTICKLVKPAEYECDESWLEGVGNV